MARVGIDGADLTRIQTVAGQRNKSAINYYFGGRTGLLYAIGDRHRAALDASRVQILDELTARGDVTIEQLAVSLVEPLAGATRTASGRCYAIILHEAMAREGSAFVSRSIGIPHTESVRRLHELLSELLPGSAAAKGRRIGQALLIAVAMVADLAREIDADPEHPPQLKRRTREISGIVAAVLRADALDSEPKG